MILALAVWSIYTYHGRIAVNWRLKSFKVIDFCGNRKPTYNFQIEINCRPSSILHRFRYIASRTETAPPTFEPLIKEHPSNFVIKLGRQRDNASGYILVKTAWSWLHPFCHNILASQTYRRRQTTSWGIAELAMQLQRSAENYRNTISLDTDRWKNRQTDMLRRDRPTVYMKQTWP